MAWAHYRLRKAGLEAAVPLGASAPALVARIGEAPARTLPRLDARLYRLQRASAGPVSTTEWRRIWAAYRAHRGAVGA